MNNELVATHPIALAAKRIATVAKKTPLEQNMTASNEFEADIFFKREDLQVVRSYKIRGAYNKIVQLTAEEKQRGIICASAGNHAQGVALSCSTLKVHGKIFMPSTTPRQKIEQVKMFGGKWVQVVLEGDTYDDANKAAAIDAEINDLVTVHPFNDEKIIEGQATVGYEILNQAEKPIDYLFLPVGGGGLASGVAQLFKEFSPNTKIIGVEPEGAPSLTRSLEAGTLIELSKIDKFVDGAAVQRMGEITFERCQKYIDDVVLVHEGAICYTILNLYNRDAIVIEPAGAMSVTALNQYKDELKGKHVVCILSGSNNDITRMEEMKEKALLYQGLKHYFIIEFPQRAGALREFINIALDDETDISYFQYNKRINRESGPVVIGVEFKRKEQFEPMLERFNKLEYEYQYLNDNALLYSTLIG